MFQCFDLQLFKAAFVFSKIGSCCLCLKSCCDNLKLSVLNREEC